MPTSCCARSPSTGAGTIFIAPANTSRSVAASPRNIFRKSPPSSGDTHMNTALLTTHWPSLPEATIRKLQAEKLRRYLNDVVLPFSPHYRERFSELGMSADSIRSLDDLRRIPFTSKADLLNTRDHPQRAREFLITPDPDVLARQPKTIFRALVRG